MKYLPLLLLLGCASDMPTGDRYRDDTDWCTQSGGVWYKGHMDREYSCVDKRRLMDQLNNVWR